MAENLGERFIINDVELRVNPTDIEVVEKRHVSSNSFIRENSQYSFMSKQAYSNYSVLIKFDITDTSDVEKLTRLASQLDKFPFIFIHSPRMSSYVLNTKQLASGDREVFGVIEYSFIQNFDVQNTVFLDLKLSYFNYLPFTKGFSFVDVNPKKEVTKTPKKNKAAPEKVSISQAEVDIGESNLFIDFYKNEFTSRRLAVSKYGTPEKAFSFCAFRVPKYVDKKEELIYEDYQRVVKSSVDESDPKDPKPSYEEMLIDYHYVMDENGGTDLNTNNQMFKSITITKRNNFAVLNMSGWSHASLQYMGKGPTSSQIQIEIDSSPFNGSDGITHPIHKLKTAFATMDVNRDKYRQYAAYNVIKLECFLTAIVPVFGFVLDQESTFASASEQGKDMYVYNLEGSDARYILEGARFNSAGTRDRDFSTKFMLDIIELIYGDFIKADEVPMIESYAFGIIDSTIIPAARLLARAAAGDAYPISVQMKRLGNILAEAHNSDFDNFTQLPFLIDFHRRNTRPLKDSDPSPVKPSQPDKIRDFNPEVARDFIVKMTPEVNRISHSTGLPPKAVMAIVGLETNWGQHEDAWKFSASHFFNMMKKNPRYNTALSRGEIEHFFHTLHAEGFKGSGAFNYANPSEVERAIRISRSSEIEFGDAVEPSYKEKALVADRDVQSVFYNLLKLAEAGNKFAKPHMEGLTDYIKKNYESIIDDFKGEALTDIAIGESLPDLSKYGLSDPRQLEGFFFVKDDPYIDSKAVQGALSISQVVDKHYIEETMARIAREDTGVNISSGKVVDPGKGDYNRETDYSEIVLQAGSINSGGEERLREDVFKSLDSGDIDPYNEEQQLAYHADNIGSYFSKGLNLAFPVIKIYMVEGDESLISNHFGNPKFEYYELRGVVSAQVVTNDDENPVDVLYLNISNPNSVYSDRHVMMEAFKPRKNHKALDTSIEDQVLLDSIRIKTGTRLHVKAGYSNDINKLETIFNGVISEVSGESILEVIAEGYGRELVLYEHGDDPSEDNFFLSASTEEIIANFLYTKEIEHFGKVKIPGIGDNEARSMFAASPSGIFQYAYPTELFTNIYQEKITAAILGEDDTFGTNVFNAFSIFSEEKVAYHFPIYRTTPWSALKEMEFRHPGSLSKPVIYGDRMSYFFGIKEQLYVYRSLAADVVSNLPSNGLFHSGDEVYNRLRSLRFRPVADFHVLTSEHNILSNKLKVTDEFDTVVNVQHYSDEDAISSGKFDYYEMKLDDNLKPHAHRRGELSMPGINGEYLAYKYGAVYLKKEAEKMYDGKIVVIGNPRMKAGDFAYIDDKTRGLVGTIKIRKCVHFFDVSRGYLCEITPGLYVENSHFNYSDTFLKIQTGIFNLVQMIRLAANLQAESGHSYQLGVTLADASNLKYTNSGLRLDMITKMSQERLEVAGAVAATVGIYGTIASTSHGKTLYNAYKSGHKKVFDTLLKSGKTVNEILGKSKYFEKTIKAVQGSLKFGGSIIKIGRYATGPLAVVGSVVLSFFTSTYQEASLTRQPVRMFPLLCNGSPYIGGIYGYRENGYFESKVGNISETGRDISYLSGLLWHKITTRASGR